MIKHLALMLGIIALANGVVEQTENGINFFVLFSYFIGSLCLSAWENLNERHNSNS